MARFGVAGGALPRLVAGIFSPRVAGAAKIAAATFTTDADPRRDGAGRAAKTSQ